MGQVTIYLDGDTEKRLKKSAKARGIPVSRWIAQLIQEKTATEWPQAVRESAGAWSNFPEQEQLRKQQGEDIPREPF